MKLDSLQSQWIAFVGLGFMLPATTSQAMEDISTGRWITRDPLGYNTLNLFPIPDRHWDAFFSTWSSTDVASLIVGRYSDEPLNASIAYYGTLLSN